MHRMTPNWTWTLNNQKYSIYTNYFPHFRPFHSTISRFQDTTCIRSVKIGNAPNDPKLNLNTIQAKVLYIHWILTPEVQILVRFTLRLVVSEIQGRQKSEMHRVTPNWTWPLNSKKYPIYTTYLPPRSKFWSVLLYDQRFPRYHTFSHFPLTPMLNVPKIEQKNLPKL